MLINVIDLLKETPLFDDTLLKDDFMYLREDVFISELYKYGELYFTELQDETICSLNLGNSQNLYLSKDSGEDIINKCVLSVDNVIINDMIIQSILEIESTDAQESLYLSLVYANNSDKIQKIKKNVSNYIKTLKKYAPLISMGIVKVIANKSEFIKAQRKGEIVNIIGNSSDCEYLNETIGERLSKLYKGNIVIKPFEQIKDTNKCRFVDDITSRIYLEINDCSSEYVNTYVHSKFKPIASKDLDNGNKMVRFLVDENSLPESREAFDNWIQNSINRTSMIHLCNIIVSLEQAKVMNSSYGSSCDFSAKVLRSLNRFDMNNIMLNIETPFLKNISYEDIAKVRMDYSSSFDSYKKVLRETAYKIERADSIENKRSIENEFNERIYDEGLPDVRKAIKNMKQSMVISAGIEFGLLSIGVFNSSFLIPSLMSLTGCKFLYESKTKLNECKKHPSYFIYKSQK